MSTCIHLFLSFTFFYAGKSSVRFQLEYKSKTSIRRTIYTQLPILCAADLRSPKEFAQTNHTTFEIDSRTIISPLGLIVLPSVDS